MVDPPGHDRDNRGVAVIARPGERPGHARPAWPAARAGLAVRLGETGRQPGPPRCPDPVPELVQPELQAQVDGLAGPLRQATGGQQPPARFLERVMLPLRDAAGVLRAHLLAEGLQDLLQGRGAAGGQVPGQPPCPAQSGVQPQPSAGEPVIPVLIGPGDPAADLLRQPGQPGQVQPLRSGGGQDHVRVVPVPGRQLVGPVGDLPRPRHRQPTIGKRVGHGGMLGEPPHPPDRAAGGGGG